MAGQRLTFGDVFAQGAWKPIPNCPGRFVLRSDLGTQTLADLLGNEVNWVRRRSHAARDEVAVAELADGGLISYCRDDGTYVHTLNTAEGFLRKRTMLGV